MTEHGDHDPQMLKGVLGLLLLKLVEVREDYGYAIVVRLREQGFAGLAEGTVYPALSRLEAQGLLEARLVRSNAGPARKYYRPTDAGHAEMHAAGHRWHRLVTAVAGIVPDPPPPATTTPTPSPTVERTPR